MSGHIANENALNKRQNKSTVNIKGKKGSVALVKSTVEVHHAQLSNHINGLQEYGGYLKFKPFGLN